MSAIGILGGMGPQASLRLYDLIIRGTQQYNAGALDEDYPEIILFNTPVPNFISNKNGLIKARSMLVERTKILENSGSIVNGIACNTAHILLPELQAATAVPFVSIPELVTQEIRKTGYGRVGLLATPTTLSSTLFDTVISVNSVLVKPSQVESNRVEGYIYKQLCGGLTPKDRIDFTAFVEEFAASNKLDAVILGCTELPLIFLGSRKVDTIDTLQLLADALLDRYFDVKLRYNREEI